MAFNTGTDYAGCHLEDDLFEDHPVEFSIRALCHAFSIVLAPPMLCGTNKNTKISL
jgi:hypothetical protein